MRLSAAAKGIVDRALALAAERAHKTLRLAHVLLAIVDDNEGIVAIGKAQLSRRRLRDALVSELGSASPYRSATPVDPASDALLAALARTLSFTKRIGVVETAASDVHEYVIRSEELAALVSSARFDPDRIDAFARGAEVAARKYRSPFVLVEHALLHALEVDEVRDPLVRAGFDTEALATKLAAHAEWSHSGAIVAAPKLLEFAVLKANVADAATLSLTPILADVLRRDVTRKTLTAAGIDAHDVLVALVHGVPVHVDPEGAVRPELVFHDDDMTTMEHVVIVLQGELELSAADAIAAMIAIHKEGRSTLSVGSRDARAIAKAIRARSKAAGMPLRVELVPM